MTFRPMITARQLGTLLGVSEPLVARWRAAARLPGTTDEGRDVLRELGRQGVTALAAGNPAPSREPRRSRLLG
jgi:hypothetical protein